jgi:hypothetical protein
MARRSKYSGMQFNRPLVLPTSKRVFHCYATHGKGGSHYPPWDSAIRILVINGAREVRWVDARFNKWGNFVCPQLAGDYAWSRLGWIMADGSLPLGELDAVDPELTQLGYLAMVDTTQRSVGPTTPVGAHEPRK